jgi:hypothetical protein
MATENYDIATLRQKATVDLPTAVAELCVEDAATLARANEYLRGIRILRARIDEAFDPIIAAAHKAHREALDQKHRIEGPVLRSEATVKGKMGAYIAEQERLRKAAEEAAIEAKRRADEERERAAKAKKDAEDAALEAAVAAEAAGDKEAAEDIIEETLETAQAEMVFEPPPVVPEKIKLEGGAIRRNWRFRIADESLIPREYLIPDEVKIGRVVRAMKDKANIPGVVAFEEIDPVAGIGSGR